MQQKLRPNPIYAVLRRVKTKEVDSTPELTDALREKTSKEAKPYFLISLDKAPNPEMLGETVCQIQKHHISVYETYNDKNLVFSAYHYTATIQINGIHYTLHGYFNKFGQLLDILVRDSDDNPFTELDQWHLLFRKISTQYTLNMLTEVFNIIDALNTRYDQELKEVSCEIDGISESLYCGENDDPTIKRTSKQYLKAINKYIECQSKCNEVSLKPDHKKILFLQNADQNFKAPESTSKIKTPTPVKQEKEKPKTTAGKKEKPAAKGRKTFTERYVQIIPLIPLDIQTRLQRIEELEKQNTADNIIEQQSLLSECAARMVEVPDNMAMDIFIKINTLMIKANIAFKMFVQIGDINSVTKLLPLVSIITQSMICIAAKNGHIAILSMLLEKYKGPKKIMNLINKHPHIYSVLSPEEGLPTPSLQVLLKFGVDPNEIDQFGRSLLYISVVLGDIDRAIMILDAGANIDQHTSKASHRIELESLPFIDPSLSQKTLKAINQSARNFAIRYAKTLSDKIPVISSTPIMCAVQKRSLPFVRLFKDRGCDFTLTDDNGLNAFSTALIRPVDNPTFTLNEELITFLINECGLDINMLHGTGKDKKPALFFLVEYSEVIPNIRDDIAVLLRFNADPNVMCEYIARRGEGEKAYMSSFSMAISQAIATLLAGLQENSQGYIDLAELMLNQSRIQIAQQILDDAYIMINMFKPEYREKFMGLCIEHTLRFAPIPRIAEDRNGFFNSQEQDNTSGPSLECKK